MKIFYQMLMLGLLVSCNTESECTEEYLSQDKHPEFIDGPGLNVAFLIMDGTYNTEFTAPYDIFHHTRFRDDIDAMDLFTVAKSTEPITTFEGLQITPDFNYQDPYMPSIDILVIPSAEHHLDSDLEDENLIRFIKEADGYTQYMTSHCDGAFLLAEAGLLDNKHCTTFPGDIQEMRNRYSSPIIHDSVLFVHNGKYITSAGGAKSFEAALYLCQILYGKENAEQIAEGMVIDWNLSSVDHLVVE